MLISLIYGVRSNGFCDELDPKTSITYDYNGERYNCFRNWGDEKYKLDKNTMINDVIEKWNSKDLQKVCTNCWAGNLSHLCSFAVMQGVFDYGFNVEGKCSNEIAFNEVLEQVIHNIEIGNLTNIINNFSANFKIS